MPRPYGPRRGLLRPRQQPGIRPSRAWRRSRGSARRAAHAAQSHAGWLGAQRGNLEEPPRRGNATNGVECTPFAAPAVCGRRASNAVRSPVMPHAEHTLFTGSIPAFYDRHLGPVIFEPYARDLARRVPAAEGVRVLETACGTGIVTRQVLALLPASASYAATDLNQDMVDHARAAIGSDRRVEWRTADAQALPFGDGAFDALIMQFGMMFVPAKDRALAEARRVLAPGGRFVFSVWDAWAKNPFGRITYEVGASDYPDDPPSFYRT